MFKDMLLDFGFSENDCKKIFSNNRIKTSNDETLCTKFVEFKNYFLNLGYVDEEIVKMLKSIPSIVTLNADKLTSKYNYLLALGYSDEDIYKMWKKFPTLISLKSESINDKIEDMIKMGYTKKEIIDMTKRVPVLYSYSSDTMKQRMDNLISLNYTKEEALKITKEFPDIYGLTVERIKEKIDFYDSIDMHGLAVEAPKYLMQSIELSYARYQFYLSIGKPVNMCDYRCLFIGEDRFKQVYTTTREDILEKYNYRDNLKNKKLVK